MIYVSWCHAQLLSKKSLTCVMNSASLMILYSILLNFNVCYLNQIDSKLYCPAVYLNENIIDYLEKTKYLGYSLCLLMTNKVM